MLKSQKRPDSKKSKKKEKEVFNLGYYNKKTVHNLSEWWGIAAILFIIIIGIISKYQLYRLPKALTKDDLATHPHTFIAERAWADLRILTEFGPRIVGSYANEVLAVDFLKRETAYIKQQAHRNQKIEIDVQQVTGAYWLGFKPHGLTNVYRGVQNVIVKLAGKQEGHGNTTLLVNCHFDSVPGSPGASDDAAHCCVMLETLRILSKKSEINEHSIIFLFNGAEESPLQAAHGFISQHKWASNVDAFVNLESAGSNGREILFQSGPNHSWLIEKYKQSATHPLGHSLGEEIFQSGIIPSDTDFRVFRDFANIPGMDFAHAMNGYRYHTKYDHINYLSMDTLQNTGDNMLALIETIANCEELHDTSAHKDSVNVYYDILGWIFVSYSEQFGYLINLAVSILAIWIPDLFLRRTTKGIHVKHIRYETMIGFFTIVLAFAVSLGLCYGIAYELDLNNNTMSWYHYNFIAMMLYGSPSLLVYCIFHRYFTPRKESPLSLSLKVQARLNGVNIMWSLLTSGVTLMGYRGIYMTMIPLLLVTITNIIIGVSGFQNSIQKWLYVHVIGQIGVLLWTTFAVHLLYGLLIPITGRSGGAQNPEIIVGILTAFLTIFATSYLTPLVSLLNRARFLWIVLVAIFLIARIGFVSLTDIGFPYRDERPNGFPTPQRHYITHATRTFYDQNGKTRYTDSGFWFKELDRNSWKTIESLVAPDILLRQDENPACSTETLCGLPISMIRQLYTGGFWLAGPQPILREQGSLKLLSKKETTPGKITEFKFAISGSMSLSMHIRMKPDAELIKWNLNTTIPSAHIYNDHATYFLILSHGTGPSELDLSLTIQSANEGSKFDITLVTNHYEYYREHTQVFANMLNKLPSWAYAVPSVSSVVSWTFA